MKANRELENHLSDLPGVGPRQAKRIVYALLKKDLRYSRRLGELITNVRQNMKLCQETFHFFYADDHSVNTCEIARDPDRDHGKVLVVETNSDLENIEKNHLWDGTYFVLGGVLKPGAQLHDFERFIRLADFKRIINNKYQDKKLYEVIMALSSTVAGDYTTEKLTEIVNSISPEIPVKILGRGLSTGTSLEYIDPTTFNYALENRH